MSVNIYGSPAGVHIPVATDFRANQTASSRYRYRRVVPDGNQSNLTTQASATQDINFRFGSGYVLNLAETRLRIFELWNSTASVRTYVRALPPIRGIRLQTSAGVILFDIQNFDAYMSCVYPFTHKSDDRAKEAVVLGGSGWGSTRTKRGSETGPYHNSTTSLFTTAPDYAAGLPFPGTSSTFKSIVSPFNGGVDATAAIGAMTPGGPLIFPGIRSSQTIAAETKYVVHTLTHANYELAHRFVPYECSNAYISPVFESVEVKTGPVTGYAHQSYDAVRGLPRQYIPIAKTSGSALTFQWDMPLRKLLPHTICAALQDLYFGTDLMLTITMASHQSRSFQCHGQRGDGGEVMFAVNNLLQTTTDVADTTLAATADHTYPRNYGSISVYGGAVGSSTGNETTAGTMAVETVQDMLLATQENLDLVNSVKSEIASKGMRLPVQQPFMAIENVSAASSTRATPAPVNYTRTIRANVARGASILRFYTGFLLSWSTNPENGGVVYAKRLPGNPCDGVWHSYRANLNAVPVADSVVAPWEQFKRQEKVHEGSLLPSFAHWSQASGIVVEDYTSAFDLSKTTPEGGLPLANPIEIQLDWACQRFTDADTVENVFIGVMLKYLSISPAGVTLESV